MNLYNYQPISEKMFHDKIKEMKGLEELRVVKPIRRCLRKNLYLWKYCFYSTWYK